MNPFLRLTRKAKNRLRNLQNFKGKTKAAQIKFNTDLIADTESNPLIANSKPGKGILNDLEVLVLDNEITDIQRAVLNNPDPKVQRARTKPLSFGRLPEMIEKIANKMDESNKLDEKRFKLEEKLMKRQLKELNESSALNPRTGTGAR